jgi:hypothetical protein
VLLIIHVAGKACRLSWELGAQKPGKGAGDGMGAVVCLLAVLSLSWLICICDVTRSLRRLSTAA